jgi:hypothetical protein
MTITWLQEAEFPQASLTVHFRVTIVGHVPTAASIYVTNVIPHASEATPWFVAFINTGKLDEASDEEYTGPETYETSHPSIFLGTAHVTITGFVVSLTLIVCVHVDECPHASDTVHLRVTTIGHAPVFTSLYVTAVIPQASEALPRLTASENTNSDEVAVIGEYGGSEIAPRLHPSIFLVVAHVTMTGFVVSFTLIV